jgi:hypothetical protein
MRNNRDSRGVPTFFAELKPVANAIAGLKPANLPASTPASKLGEAQRKRERKALKRLARSKGSAA